MKTTKAPPSSAAETWPPATVAGFRTSLLAWFDQHGRDYPWRQTHDPYAVLVSEIMLQQTQIATVLGRGFYTRWMAQFPDLHALARAEEALVLRAWEGLGYYSRARNLHRTAQLIVMNHGGVFPRDHTTILALPGIGRYTAGAIVSFAYDEPAPIVDGNVARVLTRLMAEATAIDSPAGQRWLWATAAMLLDGREARRFNSALMELGQTYCSPRDPHCAACPVASFCKAAGRDPTAFPAKSPARAIVAMNEYALWALHDDHLLLHQATARRRHGLWMLPLRERAEIGDAPLLSRSRYAITHHRVDLQVFAAPHPVAIRDGEVWIARARLNEHPMPGPLRRVVDALLDPNPILL
jgi:A/G-specific adenine glycosylase